MLLAVALAWSLSIDNSPLEAKKVSLKLTVPKAKTKSETRTISREKGNGTEKQPSDDQPDESAILDNIVFTGYDKPAVSGYESFFVRNNTDFFIKELKIEISYHLLDGRKLHTRTETVSLEIPPNDIRKVDIKSWDKQNNFNFHKSSASRRPTTPYDVRFFLKSIRVKR